MAADRSSRGSSAPPSLAQIVLWATLAWLMWRGTLLALDFLALHMTAERTPNPHADWRAFPGRHVLDAFFRWDAGWYRRIVEHGYSDDPKLANTVAFFPLFPALARAAGALVGDPLIGGLIINQLATIGALTYLHLIAIEHGRPNAPHRAAFFLLVFPASFFLSVFYSEAVFLLTLTGGMHHALRGEYFRSGLWGMLATLSRPTGVILFAAVALPAFVRVFTRRAPPDLGILWVFLMPLGLLLYMAMLDAAVDNPMAFVEQQAKWGRDRTMPWTGLWLELQRIDWSFPREQNNTQRFIDALTAIGLLVAGLWMAATRRYRAELWLLVLFGVLMPLSTGSVLSMVRFASVLFPVFLFLADACEDRPQLERWVTLVFVFGLGFYSLRYATWHWAG